MTRMNRAAPHEWWALAFSVNSAVGLDTTALSGGRWDEALVHLGEQAEQDRNVRWLRWAR